MRPSLTLPFVNGALTLDSWQPLVFCDFDTTLRTCPLIVPILDEPKS